MEPLQNNKKKRKQLTSEDLKRRLYQRGIHGSSMPSLKNHNVLTDKSSILYVNLNSSLNKRQKTSSPKILKKTASAFAQTFYNYKNDKNQNNPGSQSPKGYFPKLTANDFHIKKRSHFANFRDSSSKLQQNENKEQINVNNSSPKTAINFYKRRQDVNSEPSQQINTQNSSSGNKIPANITFNSSFYKNDSILKYNENKMTKRLVQKMSGRNSPLQNQNELNEQKNKYSLFHSRHLSSPNNNDRHVSSKSGQKSRSKQKQKDQIIQKDQQEIKNSQKDHFEYINSEQQNNNKKEENVHVNTSSNTPSLEQYIKLILKNVANVDQFLYLVKRSKNFTLNKNSSSSQSQNQSVSNYGEDNIYQLDIIDYQKIKSKDKEPNFQYYTISKKGFCHYQNGKPIEFIDLHQWLSQKEIYQKIKNLNFFNRFRRWKTIKMWIKKVVRHRIEKCSNSLQEKLFILNPIVRTCILQIKEINLQMEKGLAIISRNQGTYSLESFKHCQEKTRRQAAGIVEEFSHRSRQSVKKCFESNLQNLKQILKTKTQNQDKNFAATSHNPKDNAFQVLGFPAKMSYQHRSKLRKLTGRFVRFSYLVDMIHLNGLANIFRTQIQNFSQKLNTLQVQAQVQVHYSHNHESSNSNSNRNALSVVQNSKNSTTIITQQNQKQKMFNIQLVFKPTQVQQYSIRDILIQHFDISMKVEKAAQIFNPVYHIKQKQTQVLPPSKKRLLALEQERLLHQKPPQSLRKYIPNLCDLWLTLRPTLDNIFDELSFLIKQSMGSLKYFERWSKHRQMQKYINILQQWDDIVSQNWQISQNDNLDPISIIDNIQTSMSKIKQMIHISQNKLTSKLVQQTLEPLNIYWQNIQAEQNVQKLLLPAKGGPIIIQNSAQIIQFYLTYMAQQIQIFEIKIPNSIELGIFSISMERTKAQIISFMKQKFQAFKNQLPLYVQQHTTQLNNWLNQKSQRLRQQIHNIDDFVRLNKSLKQIQAQFFVKKDLCNDLGHIYQTMYNFKIQTKKRKQFEVQTLKLKDQLQQYLINVQQTIQRKTQFFTREVSRYHIPGLLKQIQKISDNINSQEFESLKSTSGQVISKLQQIQQQYAGLKQKKQKCLEYLTILKLSQININQLDQLQKQIHCRLQMWQTKQVFEQFVKKIDDQIVNSLDLESIKQFIVQKRNIIKQIQIVHNRPTNQVLQILKQKVQQYFINVPLLQGFSDKLLSESHWDQIQQILKDYPSIDLRKKQFTLRRFIQTDIGKQNKKIEYIFSKAKVQNQLQQLYYEVQGTWNNTLVKSKLQSGKFIIISNPQVMRESFDYMFRTLTVILSNPFSQTLKQYSVTYNLLIGYYNSFQNWMKVQEKLLKIDSQCKVLDIKKLNDYSQFQNCQKIYKNIMKLFSNRNVQNGVKMSKLFVNGLDQKLQEMEQCLRKVQQNIKSIIEEHRKNYPPFYLFDDQSLFNIITQTSNPSIIESTAKFLIPCISRIQFQSERISAIYNYDAQKVHKNMISINSDIEQILLQITDTIGDVNKKNMRSCRYKSVQTSLVKLIPFFQTQYLLAINKIDFSNYTQISIDNQGMVSDSLKEFYKVMKKDITEDLKIRSTLKSQFIPRYDSLILQNLLHQQLLSQIIKKRVQKTSDFDWQNQLRFYWDESTNNNDDMNITIKHLYSKIKYGNQYIGSRCHVIQNSCDNNLLSILQNNQKSIYLGATYTLERLLSFIGYRMVIYDCAQQIISSNSMNHIQIFKNLNNFLIGNWYSQSICFYKNFNLIPLNIQNQILSGLQIQVMKQNLLKKNIFNIKENQKRQNAIFLSYGHYQQEYIKQDDPLRAKYRAISHNPIKLNHLKNILKIQKSLVIYESASDNDVAEYLLKLFEMIEYFEEKSHSYDLSLQDFLDNFLTVTQNKHSISDNHNETQIEQSFLTKKQLFTQFIKYIKPKVGLDNLCIFEEGIKLYLMNESVGISDEVLDPLRKKDSILENQSIIIGKHDKHKSKDKLVTKRSSSRNSQQVKSQSPNSSQGSRSNQKRRQKSKILTNKPHLRDQDNSLSNEDQEKYKQLKIALEERNLIIAIGTGESKLHAIKKIFTEEPSDYKVIQVYSFTQSEYFSSNGGIVKGYIEQYLKNNSSIKQSSQNQTCPIIEYPSHLVFYFSGLNSNILRQLQALWQSQDESVNRQNISHNKGDSLFLKSFKSFLKQYKIYIIIGTQNLNNYDYSQLSSFYIINVQLTHAYLVQIGRNFSLEIQKQLNPQFNSSQNSSTEAKIQQNKSHSNTSPANVFMKFYTDTLLSTFQNWGIKDIKLKQKNIYIFLTYLKSLLPIKANKLLEAMVYCFIRVFSNLDADYIKLQFLVKKLLGEQICSQDHKVYDLVYIKRDPNAVSSKNSTPNSMTSCKSITILPDEGLIYSSKYLQKFQQEYLNNNSLQKLYYFDYVITPQLYHYQTIMKRILQNTSSGIWITGAQKSGKSSLYEIFKHLNYSNKSWLKMTMNDHKQKQDFYLRILNNLNIHSLREMKSKINYQKSIFMIDDINMEFSASTQMDLNPNNVLIRQKITLIRQLLKYSIVQYPSTYNQTFYSSSNNSSTNNSLKQSHSSQILAHNAFHKKLFKLQKSNFILAGRQQLQILKDCTIPIQTSHQHDNQSSKDDSSLLVKSIFVKYLRNKLQYSEINNLTINDIVLTTYEICKKLGTKIQLFDGMELGMTKYILSKFNQLKVKDCSNIVKQVQKYWVYILQQQLFNYEKYGSSFDGKSSLNTGSSNNQPLNIDQSIIYKQLKNLNIQQILKTQPLLYSNIHNKDTTYGNKKLELVKDIKRIFNIINQKIDKYNESQNKRYGNSFDFINFDELIKKIIKISNNLNNNRDYLLYGRRGMGKESLVKLIAYLQGSNYKLIAQNQMGLKNTILDIFCNTNITTMSSYIVTFKIPSVSYIQQLKQFYSTDFQSQILGHKDMEKHTKVPVKQKELLTTTNNNSLTQQKQYKSGLSSTNKGGTIVSKAFGNMSLLQQQPQYYIAPHPRLQQQDTYMYRNAIRIVLLTSQKQVIQQIPSDIVHNNILIDFMDEVPLASLQEYNIKLLDVDQIKYTPKCPQLLSQIFNYQKQNLALSLKSNDDCIRLFNSFYMTLKGQIQEEIVKYGRIIQLFNQMRKLHQSLESQVQEYHAKIKKVNQFLLIEQSQERKEQKSLIQAQLHKKSTCLNKNQKIIEMLNMLVPYFKDKHSAIIKYVYDNDYFQQCLVLAASYFTYLSEYSYTQRRKILQKWYKNQKIPALMNSQSMIKSFLPLFNLYPEQFNAQPIDDLEDFYQNMAIVFNSIKPIIIRDNCKKAKSWLQTVCSFVIVSQKQQNFVDIICQNLTKPSNILIQIVNQQTLNNISSNFINTLLFLGESTQTISIKGQQIKVSPQAKFYLLLGDGIVIPQQMKSDFAVVCFNQSQKLLQKMIEYTYMGVCHPETFFTQIDFKKKIRNLKLQQQALMVEIADNIYAPFQNNQNDEDNEDQNKEQVQNLKKTLSTGNKKQLSSSTTSVKKQLPEKQINMNSKTYSKQDYERCLLQISDKTMTRGQNLANKLKQKQELCKDLQHKRQHGSNKFSQELNQFTHKSKNLLSILQHMSKKSSLINNSISLSNQTFSYPLISHQQFIKKINGALKRNFIIKNNHMTLYLFAIKMWGPQYIQKDFYVFLLFILSMVDKTTSLNQMILGLNEEKSKSIDSFKENRNHRLRIPVKNDQSNHQTQKSSHINQNLELISRFLPYTKLRNDQDSSNSLQIFMECVRQNLIDFLNNHFTYEQLMPYLQFRGTLNNIGSQTNENSASSNKIILNCVWINNQSNNQTSFQNKNFSVTAPFIFSSFMNSKQTIVSPSSFLQQQNQQKQDDLSSNMQSFLLSNNNNSTTSYGNASLNGLKVISLQFIKDINNIQNEIKKHLFEENILVINSVQILQITIQILRKLGSQQKVLYFKCPIFKDTSPSKNIIKSSNSPNSLYSNTKNNTLSKVVLISKKYGINEINYMYVRKNKLLQECLDNIQKQRDLKNMASVSNIKSLKSIAMIPNPSQMQNEKNLQSLNQPLVLSTKTSKESARNQNPKKTLFIPSNQKALSKTLQSQKTQKTITLSQETSSYWNNTRIEEVSQKIKQILQKIYFIIDQQIYLTFNICKSKRFQQESNNYVNKQIEDICNYVVNLLMMSINEQQSSSLNDSLIISLFEQKIYLMLKIIQFAKKQTVSIFNQQLNGKLSDIKIAIQNTFKQVIQNQQVSTKNSKLINANQILDEILAKMDEIVTKLNEQASNANQSITKLHLIKNNCQHIKFEQQFIIHFKKYLFYDQANSKSQSTQSYSKSSQQTELYRILKKAKQIYSSLKNVNQPIAVKRNTRKSVNAIFKKQEIKQKVFTSNVISTTLNQAANKKPGTAEKQLKRVSKQTLLSNKKQQELKLKNNTQQSQTFLTQLMIEIQYKKIESKLNYLTHKIQNAIHHLQEMRDLYHGNKQLLRRTNLKTQATIDQSIILILLLLQDKIPLSWLILFPSSSNISISLSTLIKKNLRLQQDTGFTLDKIKRSKHSEIDFNLIKYPSQYIQFHFKHKISPKIYEPAIYMLSNAPTNEQLQNCIDYLKLTNIQSNSFKFASDPNTIDVINANSNSINTNININGNNGNSQNKPSSSQGKISTGCYFIKKQQSSAMSSTPSTMMGTNNNLTAIFVYETKPQKQNAKPIMKIYANTKKNTNIASLSNTGLSLWLKEECQ